MYRHVTTLALAFLMTAAPALALAGNDSADDRHKPRPGRKGRVQLGPRPCFLIDDLEDGKLRRKLESCSAGPFEKRDFSIGHRGAALQTTTNILAMPLGAKCTHPFVPAMHDAAGNLVSPAVAECRTSDITLAEFKTLRGKMDAFNPRARTVAEYLGGTSSFRTDLYAGPTSGQLLTLRESIALFRSLAVKMTPELKGPVVEMPFNGFTRQAVYLDDANFVAELPSFSDLIITWTLERSGILADGNNGFYYQTVDAAIAREGDMLRVLDVLAKDVGVLGVFSDWPAAVTYYANCMGLK